MPEAAIYEHRDPCAHVEEVRCPAEPRDRLAMEAVTREASGA